MPYIKLEGIKHFQPEIVEEFKKELIAVFAQALNEPENRLWLHCDLDGYWNSVKQREIVIITLYDDKDEKVFEKVVEAIEKLIEKYQLTFGIDIHLIESRLYHSFFSKQTQMERQQIILEGSGG